MADRHRSPAVLAFTALLVGQVAMLVSPVESDETQAGTTAGEGVYQSGMFPNSQADEFRGDQGSAASVSGWPPPDILQTPDPHAQKITEQDQIFLDLKSRGETSRRLPQDAAVARGHQGSGNFDTASRTASSDGPTLTVRFENAPPLADQQSPVQPPQASRVTQIVAVQYRRAMSLAEKGALYAAEEQLIKTLWLIAQSGDEAEGPQGRGDALAAALKAWREAEDLAPALEPNATDAQVTRLIAAHSTPVRQVASEGSTPAVDVLQEYYAYSQVRLLQAVGHEPGASLVLYGLGRLQTAPSRIPSPGQRLAGAKAIALLQTALQVDARNFAASNELGVLLARCGRLEESKAVFLQSVSVANATETWKNLATVGERMGDGELARYAQLQYRTASELQAKTAAVPASSSLPEIRWVSLATFADAPPETGVPANVPPPAIPTPKPKENSEARGLKGLFGWFVGTKVKSSSPQPPNQPTTALRNVPTHFAQ